MAITLDLGSAVVYKHANWARSCENLSYVICEQQRRRSACASAQSDQHLCCSLLRQYDMYTCYIQSVRILASFCSWVGWFESYLVKHLRRHIFAWCGSIVRSTWKISTHLCIKTANMKASFNPNLSNGLSHHYHLDESTFNFRGIRSIFFFIFISIFIEIPVSSVNPDEQRLRRLICVCTVCLCPKNRTPGLYGLTVRWNKMSTQQQDPFWKNKAGMYTLRTHCDEHIGQKS